MLCLSLAKPLQDGLLHLQESPGRQMRFTFCSIQTNTTCTLIESKLVLIDLMLIDGSWRLPSLGRLLTLAKQSPQVWALPCLSQHELRVQLWAVLVHADCDPTGESPSKRTQISRDSWCYSVWERWFWVFFYLNTKPIWRLNPTSKINPLDSGHKAENKSLKIAFPCFSCLHNVLSRPPGHLQQEHGKQPTGCCQLRTFSWRLLKASDHSYPNSCLWVYFFSLSASQWHVKEGDDINIEWENIGLLKTTQRTLLEYVRWGWGQQLVKDINIFPLGRPSLDKDGTKDVCKGSCAISVLSQGQHGLTTGTYQPDLQFPHLWWSSSSSDTYQGPFTDLQAPTLQFCSCILLPEWAIWRKACFINVL